MSQIHTNNLAYNTQKVLGLEGNRSKHARAMGAIILFRKATNLKRASSMANAKSPVQLYSFSQKIFNATTLELKFIATNSYEPYYWCLNLHQH